MSGEKEVTNGGEDFMEEPAAPTHEIKADKAERSLQLCRVTGVTLILLLAGILTLCLYIEEHENVTMWHITKFSMETKTGRSWEEKHFFFPFPCYISKSDAESRTTSQIHMQWRLKMLNWLTKLNLEKQTAVTSSCIFEGKGCDCAKWDDLEPFCWLFETKNLTAILTDPGCNSTWADYQKLLDIFKGTTEKDRPYLTSISIFENNILGSFMAMNQNQNQTNTCWSFFAATTSHMWGRTPSQNDIKRYANCTFKNNDTELRFVMGQDSLLPDLNITRPTEPTIIYTHSTPKNLREEIKHVIQILFKLNDTSEAVPLYRRRRSPRHQCRHCALQEEIVGQGFHWSLYITTGQKYVGYPEGINWFEYFPNKQYLEHTLWVPNIRNKEVIEWLRHYGPSRWEYFRSCMTNDIKLPSGYRYFLPACRVAGMARSRKSCLTEYNTIFSIDCPRYNTTSCFDDVQETILRLIVKFHEDGKGYYYLNGGVGLDHEEMKKFVQCANSTINQAYPGLDKKMTKFIMRQTVGLTLGLNYTRKFGEPGRRPRLVQYKESSYVVSIPYFWFEKTEENAPYKIRMGLSPYGYQPESTYYKSNQAVNVLYGYYSPQYCTRTNLEYCYSYDYYPHETTLQSMVWSRDILQTRVIKPINNTHGISQIRTNAPGFRSYPRMSDGRPLANSHQFFFDTFPTLDTGYNVISNKEFDRHLSARPELVMDSEFWPTLVPDYVTMEKYTFVAGAMCERIPYGDNYQPLYISNLNIWEKQEVLLPAFDLKYSKELFCYVTWVNHDKTGSPTFFQVMGNIFYYGFEGLKMSAEAIVSYGFQAVSGVFTPVFSSFSSLFYTGLALIVLIIILTVAWKNITQFKTHRYQPLFSPPIGP